MNEVARWIRKEQTARGWTNEELARRVGVNWRTVIRWKQNGRPPMPKHIAALERVFRDETVEERLDRLERELAELRRHWGQ